MNQQHNSLDSIQLTQDNIYQQVCQALKWSPVTKSLSVSEYGDVAALANLKRHERLTAALAILLECVMQTGEEIHRVDHVLLDRFIARIDQLLGKHLDDILHHPEFQNLESIWRGLAYLIKRVDFRANIKVEILNVSKRALKNEFDEVADLTQSGLYQQVYSSEYDTPGGEPVSAMISNAAFDASDSDVSLLRYLSKVAAATHCPFVGAVDAAFFHKSQFSEVMEIPNLTNYMERAEYHRWRSFRASEDARYVGLVCPKMLLRLPYGDSHLARGFCYHETAGEAMENYLWGNVSFAFAVNMARSFKEHGWAVNIRGPEAGGKVEALPLHQYDFGHGFISKVPTEAIIPETKELELAKLGFIPLCYYKNSDYACFFSANSIQQPTRYSSADATRNSRINAKLPYIFLSARIAHYLKVLQRETIGSNVSRIRLEERLNTWLQTLVTKMQNPDPEQIARHPLRDGQVMVAEVEDNPGFYHVELSIVPHFQVEGMSVNLSVVGKMPRAKV